MLTLIGWILCGWIAGAIAEWLLPPSGERQGWKTIATGIAGSIVGGVIYSAVSGSRYSPAGIAFSVVGAVACLAALRWYENNGG